MEKIKLIVNTGSASRKYALYSGDKQIIFAHLEYDEKKPVCTFYTGEKVDKIKISEADFRNSLDFAITNFIKRGHIFNKGEISSIGIRIVAPGVFFLEHKLIDKRYEKELVEASKKAPLHIAPVQEEIKRIKKIFRETKLVGISDSSFHSTLPDYAKYYGIDKKISDKIELYRFGYHGISIKSIISKLQDKSGPVPEKMVICHVGGGVSITAVKNGLSIDTSMGFTPLEGPIMATRVGDIDPGALIYLMDKSGVNRLKMLEFLNKKCGLLGLSGTSSDVRDLLAIESKEKDAKLALDMYAYRIAKFVGSYVVALGGIDAIVFSGTVGERSFIMRERICRKLQSIGISIDTVINNTTEGKDGDITGVDSTAKVLVVKTDEMQQIAREMQSII